MTASTSQLQLKWSLFPCYTKSKYETGKWWGSFLAWMHKSKMVIRMSYWVCLAMVKSLITQQTNKKRPAIGLWHSTFKPYCCRRLTRQLAYVLCYELVLGQGLKPHSPAERAFLKAGDAFLTASEDLKHEQGLENLEEIANKIVHSAHPRHVRVNLLKTNVEQALACLRNDSSAGAKAQVKCLL